MPTPSNPIRIIEADVPIQAEVSAPLPAGGNNIGNVDVATMPLMDIDGAPVTIDWLHHELHSGHLFHFEHYVANLANDGNLDILISTGASEVHFVGSISAGGQCLAYLFEAPTVADGTLIAIYNMRRSSAAAPLFTVKHTPTVTATGTVALVNGRVIPGGASPTSRVGGGVRTQSEWVLKANTSYLLRVTNRSGGTIAISAAGEGYEE